jgi:hypothetical protein
MEKEMTQEHIAIYLRVNVSVDAVKLRNSEQGSMKRKGKWKDLMLLLTQREGYEKMCDASND